jgi:vacuolar-type H+-ATPase subunit I/STV1
MASSDNSSPIPQQPKLEDIELANADESTRLVGEKQAPQVQTVPEPAKQSNGPAPTYIYVNQPPPAPTGPEYVVIPKKDLDRAVIVRNISSFSFLSGMITVFFGFVFGLLCYFCAYSPSQKAGVILGTGIGAICNAIVLILLSIYSFAQGYDSDGIFLIVTGVLVGIVGALLTKKGREISDKMIQDGNDGSAPAPYPLFEA